MGSAWPRTSWATRCAGCSTSPRRGRDVYATLFITSSPTPTKAALNLLGHDVGGLRLPMVEADEHELEEIKAMLTRHGLLERAATA